ncbi:MAG TPA: selenium cofactor biosynthesis protein YqeC, partial [Phototrophicaceae bacterium]|nr:selenium cofactor biosynthesis protein YqeC [Phototrophicaceae bacterium]
MKLHQAFEIVPGDVVSFIGAGGKTSLLVALGYELAEAGWRVLATSTVGMDDHQLELMPHALPLKIGAEAISSALTHDRFVFVYDSIRHGKVHGIKPFDIPEMLDTVDSDVWLVEADVSAGLSIKAPYPDEPIIPAETTLVVPVASMSALSQTFDDDHVYNAQAIIDKYGFARDTRIKSAWLAQILRDEDLGLYGV